MAQRPVILIVGGGYVGLYTALRLQKRLARGQADVVVVDPQPHMTLPMGDDPLSTCRARLAVVPLPPKWGDLRCTASTVETRGAHGGLGLYLVGRISDAHGWSVAGEYKGGLGTYRSPPRRRPVEPASSRPSVTARKPVAAPSER